MKVLTRTKLFRDGERYNIVAQVDGPNDTKLTLIVATNVDNKSRVAWIQEWPGDGFEVYVATPGNSIEAARDALGLTNGD